MLILNSQVFSDQELLTFAADQSSQKGSLEQKLLHWEFGPLMHMKYNSEATNYLFSDSNVPFHWDGAFYKVPMKLLFFCVESNGPGGETLFTNTEKIWNSLTINEQELCKKVTLTYETKKLAHYGGKISVPLVQQHPITGATILRLAEKVETHLNPVDLKVDGIEKPNEFYQFLVEKLYFKDFIYEHHWEAGDLLICDNYTYLHGRRSLMKNLTRSFKRIQIL